MNAWDLCRRVIGSLLELGIKAYGSAAAASVALSDAETVGGKVHDALAAVPSLMERYRQARYVFEHRKEIQGFLEYVHQHAPDARQIEAAVQKSYAALDRVKTVFSEIGQAKEAFASLHVTTLLDLSLQTLFDASSRAIDHLGRAWQAMPDLDSISHLANVAQNVTPVLGYLNGLEIDFASLYGGLLAVVDNFARDEITGTLTVMGAALAIAFVLGQAAGFWGRRGRPGLLIRALQGWGARVFPGWYARNLESALGRPLYAVARQRIQKDIVMDPQKALDPEAYRELERYFGRRGGGEAAAMGGAR